MFKSKKSISALIATILLIVVAVALIAIILTWGKSFTNENLSAANNLLNAPPSDAQYYLSIANGINGRFLVTYNPPSTYQNQNISITRFRLLESTNIIDLATPVDINAGDTQALDLGIITTPFDLVLYLEDNTIITKQGIKNTNRAPSAGTCPTGYVPVPGNYAYGTVESSSGGFCVARYEMKIDETGDGIGDVNTSCQNSSYATWNNGAATCGYDAGTRTLVSSAVGYPLATIAQTTSATACSSLGTNYHLITNDEWMTITRNIEQVTSNWSGGTVGSGYIYSGHNDSTPNAAIAGDTNNSNGYYLTGQSSGNQRRTLTLTNGEVIWDLSGNVWEWTNNTIQRKDQPDGYLNSTDAAYTGGFNWEDYNKASGGTYYLNSSNLGSTTLTYNDLFLLSSSTYNATNNGIGRIYTYSNSGDTDTTEYAFLRGGAWNSGSYAGLLALDLGNVPGSAGNGRGLRCVVVP